MEIEENKNSKEEIEEINETETQTEEEPVSETDNSESKMQELPILVNQVKKPKMVTFKGALAIVLAVSFLVTCISVSLTVKLMSGSGYNGLGLSRKNWEKLKWGFETVEDTYYGEIDEEKMVDGALMGLSVALDEYTMYMPKDTADQFMQDVDSDSYSGVGLYIYTNTEDNTITVQSPLKGSPAERAGIKTDDKIIAVDGVSLVGTDLEKASEMMLGEIGTKVNVTFIIAATGERKTVEFTREEIKRETVESEMLENGVGYIEISQFGVNTYSDFVDHYNNLRNEGMEKLVLDLRNNPGGYLDQVVNIADIFVEKGDVIVYTKDKEDNKVEYKARNASVQIDIVVLANGGTASASEILIGALRDYNKAVLVGEKTFGKGVTQVVIPHEDGSAFKVTDTKYYTPNGVCIDKKGFEPDIKVSDEGEEDMVLKEGLKVFE